MRISELIAELNEALAEHGDIETAIVCKQERGCAVQDNLVLGTVLNKVPYTTYDFNHVNGTFETPSPESEPQFFNSDNKYLVICGEDPKGLAICYEYDPYYVFNISRE